MSTKGKSFTRSRNAIKERESEILHLIVKYGPQSRQQLAEKLGVETGSVTAAVRNLLDTRQLIESGVRYDEASKREQTVVTINPDWNNFRGIPVPEPIVRTPKSEQIASLQHRLECLTERLEMFGQVIKFMALQDKALTKLAFEFAKSSTGLPVDPSKDVIALGDGALLLSKDGNVQYLPFNGASKAITKAMEDAIVFGQGELLLQNDGTIKHVPFGGSNE